MNLKNSYVLVLNSAWMPIGIKGIKDAIISVYDNKNWQIIQIDYTNNEPFIQPVYWDEWVKLDVPSYCEGIKTLKGLIRRPTVIISKSYSKIHFKYPKPTKKGIYDRDKGYCQYTGKKLDKNNCSVDHRIPKSKGGKDTWENMVLCDKKINSIKGSKLPSEFYLKLSKEPKEPTVTRNFTVTTTKHKDWSYFIN